MNKSVEKLKSLIDQYLYKSKNQIISVFGRPSKKSDDSMWVYLKIKLSPFNEEIIFIFDEDEVVDIVVSEYFLWIEIKNVYYFEGGSPEYKVVTY